MEPERCVFGVFFPHTGQHQPHDLVMTQGSMAASCGGLPKPCTAAHRTGCAEDQRPDGEQDGAAHAKALGGDADEATTGDHVPCEGVQAPAM